MMNELKLKIARWLLRSPDVRALVYDIVVECDDFGDTVADIAEKVAEDVVQEAERDREPTHADDIRGMDDYVSQALRDHTVLAEDVEELEDFVKGVVKTMQHKVTA